jgi:hypothetical protein
VPPTDAALFTVAPLAEDALPAGDALPAVDELLADDAALDALEMSFRLNGAACLPSIRWMYIYGTPTARTTISKAALASTPFQCRRKSDMNYALHIGGRRR